jgi:bla regulator protein BlaR1
MNTFSSFWVAIAPALGDHLWQSTLLALVAGLLTLLLQRNHARARYWLWLAASLKFLVPFSWLVAIGSRLAPKVGAVSAPAVYVTVEQLAQPFTQSPMLGAAASSAPSAVLTHLLPLIFVAVWLCGSLAVFALWCVRWRRIAAISKQAMPLTKGREIEAFPGAGNLRDHDANSGLARRHFRTPRRCAVASRDRA